MRRSLLAIFIFAVAQPTFATTFTWKITAQNVLTMEEKYYAPMASDFDVPLPGVPYKCTLQSGEPTTEDGATFISRILECKPTADSFIAVNVTCHKTAQCAKKDDVQFVTVAGGKDRKTSLPTTYMLKIECSAL